MRSIAALLAAIVAAVATVAGLIVAADLIARLVVGVLVQAAPVVRVVLVIVVRVVARSTPLVAVSVRIVVPVLTTVVVAACCEVVAGERILNLDLSCIGREIVNRHNVLGGLGLLGSGRDGARSERGDGSKDSGVAEGGHCGGCYGRILR